MTFVKGTEFLFETEKFPPAFWVDGNRFFRMLRGKELCFLRTIPVGIVRDFRIVGLALEGVYDRLLLWRHFPIFFHIFQDSLVDLFCQPVMALTVPPSVTMGVLMGDRFLQGGNGKVRLPFDNSKYGWNKNCTNY